MLAHFAKWRDILHLNQGIYNSSWADIGIQLQQLEQSWQRTGRFLLEKFCTKGTPRIYDPSSFANWLILYEHCKSATGDSGGLKDEALSFQLPSTTAMIVNRVNGEPEADSDRIGILLLFDSRSQLLIVKPLSVVTR